MKPSAFFIGIMAGLAAGLLFAGLALQSSTALGLALLAPMPILIASLGWGSAAGFVAALASAAGIALLTRSPDSALVLLVAMAMPAAIVGHLAGLARPRAPDQAQRFPPPIAGPLAPALEWFPLARVLLAIVLLAAAACLAVGWFLAYDPRIVGPAVAAALASQGGGASEAQIREFARIVVALVPFIQPALLVVVLVVNLQLSAAVTRLSGRLMRPRDDVPAAAGLPKGALGLLAVALAGALLPGTAGVIAAVGVGALIAGFTLVGLASIHRRTRGRPGRGLILGTTYAGVILLSFPILAVASLGIFETLRRPATRAGHPPPSNQR